jgi:hypothetical protein
MESAAGLLSVPTTAEVRIIAEIPDPVIRNLRITECYYRLSRAMRERVEGGANWCTFATWASRQAGCTIRGEDLLDRMSRHAGRRWSPRSPIRSLWRSLLRKGIFHPETTLGSVVKAVHSPFDAFERASEAVAAGNLRVFEEIGFATARYLHTCGADASTDSAEFTAFLMEFQAGAPPAGQDYLRQAFTHYQRQRFESAPDRRAQLQLLGNLRIGLHEQVRLQPQIQRAMEAAPETAEDLFRRILRALPRLRLLAAVRGPLTALGRAYHRFAREITRRVVSECMMVLALPEGVLALGTHLDYPFEAALKGTLLPELQALLDTVEPHGRCDDCGAEDWADLRQRMHYIAHLFRAFHFRTDLFRPPFTEAAVGQIHRGVLPQGAL